MSMKERVHNRNLLNIIKETYSDRIFLRKMLMIALPIAIQNMINILINLADTMMIGKLGEVAIASVGLGNKVFFVFTLFVFGISSGTGILSAQYYGNNDIKNIRKVLGIGFIIALIASAVFTGATILIPESLMKIFTTTPETIALGVIYISIVGISYPFTAITNLYVSTLRAMGEVRIPIIISICTILVNVTLNYTFIFGNFGAPAMGVAGAALATVIARSVETCLTITALRIIKHPIMYNIKEMWGYSEALIIQFIKTSVPVILNEFFWGLGVTIYSVVYGRMGNSAIAAITLATSIQDILVVFCHGLSGATVVLLGNELGAGRLDNAKRYGSYVYVLTTGVGIMLSIMTLFIAKPFLSMYYISEEVLNYTYNCLVVFAIFITFRALSIVNIVGILRSGGDTFFCFLLDLTGVWLIGIPAAFIGGLVLGYPIYIVYALIHIEEIYKVVVGYIRYKQYKWVRNLNLELG